MTSDNIKVCSFKSEIIIKQTLGRGMRKFGDKEVVLIFDFVDDYRINSYVNYLYRQSKDRILLYEEEHFKYNIIKKDLSNFSPKPIQLNASKKLWFEDRDNTRYNSGDGFRIYQMNNMRDSINFGYYSGYVHKKII